MGDKIWIVVKLKQFCTKEVKKFKLQILWICVFKTGCFDVRVSVFVTAKLHTTP